mmetsp:Transcript_19685/g.29839  ORF Transcript_19685/g.29839 Transcript_19685/m.29839 type:complete len:86 (-) Transcript_19685:195-452(-)
MRYFFFENGGGAGGQKRLAFQMGFGPNKGCAIFVQSILQRKYDEGSCCYCFWVGVVDSAVKLRVAAFFFPVLFELSSSVSSHALV